MQAPDTIANCRDVASAWNGIKKNRLYRSSTAYTAEDLRSLGVRTVIDLRELNAGDHPALRQQDQCRYEHLDLVGGAKFRIVCALPCWVKLKLVCIGPLYCCIKQKIRQMCAEGLVDAAGHGTGQEELYRAILDEANEGLAGALRLLTDADAPALVHCEHGKDRTGLVVALALLICDCPVEAIIDDYAKSGELLKMQRITTADGSFAIGHEGANHFPPWMLSDKMLVTPADWMRHSLQYLAEKYGTPKAYLTDHLGLTEEEQEQICNNLLVAEDQVRTDSERTNLF